MQCDIAVESWVQVLLDLLELTNLLRLDPVPLNIKIM